MVNNNDNNNKKIALTYNKSVDDLFIYLSNLFFNNNIRSMLMMMNDGNSIW
jgi:hypothetical protein